MKVADGPNRELKWFRLKASTWIGGEKNNTILKNNWNLMRRYLIMLGVFI